MKVRALRDGFHGGFRHRAGSEFEVSEGTKASWFVAVGEASKVAKPAVKTAKEPKTLSEAGKDTAKTFNEVNGENLA